MSGMVCEDEELDAEMQRRIAKSVDATSPRDAEIADLKAKLREAEAERDAARMHGGAVAAAADRMRAHEKAQDGLLRAAIARAERAERDANESNAERDALASAVGCIRCSDLLECKRHPRTRELVDKYGL